MITEIYVKNFLLIEECRLALEPGFCVLTGETGAGKSLFVEALSLLAGGRVVGSVVRQGTKEAIIEATFDISKSQGICDFLDEQGLSTDGDTLVIRRFFSLEGRNRIFINGFSATLSQLALLGPLLIDLTGQHEQQVLLKESAHLQLLDEVGLQNSPLLKEYTQVYKDYLGVSQELKQKEAVVTNRDERLEFLKFQIQELTQAALKNPHEEEDLLAEKNRIKHVGSLHEVTSLLTDVLYEAPDSLVSKTDQLRQRLTKILDLDVALEPLLTCLNEIRSLLVEVHSRARNYHDQLDVDPHRLESIESRLFLFYQLKKKYGSDLEACLKKLEELKGEASQLEHHEELLDAIRQRESTLGKQILVLAAQLSQVRKKAALKLEKRIGEELSFLAMPHVRFFIRVHSPSNPQVQDCAVGGFDRVCFEISVNPGEPPGPIQAIASGGELSRILLAVKNVLSVSNQVLTRIFDEVDSGIGGVVANAIGEKLAQMAHKGQVLAVTHLPQIASFAQCHVVIQKMTDGHTTRTVVKNLADDLSREIEIARMMGDAGDSLVSRAHARELLQRSLGY